MSVADDRKTRNEIGIVVLLLCSDAIKDDPCGITREGKQERNSDELA